MIRKMIMIVSLQSTPNIIDVKIHDDECDDHDRQFVEHSKHH